MVSALNSADYNERLKELGMTTLEERRHQADIFVAEPEPVGAKIFWLEPEPIFLGRLRLLFLTSEKQNDLKMFIFNCILYIFLHNK